MNSSNTTSLPIRLAEPGEIGVPFRDWLARRTIDRRSTERLLAFIQQWDHLPQDPPRSAQAYATMWNTSNATAYRLLDEFRATFPAERAPDSLLDLLWQGLSEPYASGGRLGALIDVPVVRVTRDLRELMPVAIQGVLETPLSDSRGTMILDSGAEYSAYEVEADRYAWSQAPSGEQVSFILERGRDAWLPAAGSDDRHNDAADAELACAVRWATGAGFRLQAVGVRVPEPPSSVGHPRAGRPGRA